MKCGYNCGYWWQDEDEDYPSYHFDSDSPWLGSSWKWHSQSCDNCQNKCFFHNRIILVASTKILKWYNNNKRRLAESIQKNAPVLLHARHLPAARQDYIRLQLPCWWAASSPWTGPSSATKNELKSVCFPVRQFIRFYHPDQAKRVEGSKS